MKRILITAVVTLGVLPAAFAQGIVREDFDSGQTPGATPEGWSTKWSLGEVPLQQNLMTVETGIGVDGSDGVKFHVDSMLGNYLSVNPNGLNGRDLTITMDTQVGLSGLSVTEDPGNVNCSLVGLAVIPSTNWWDTAAGGVATWCRRQDGFWGVRIPNSPWVEGFAADTGLGLPAGGLTPATSDWFNIRMDLTDKGPASGWAYVATVSSLDGGFSFSTTEQAIPTNYLPSGATVYAAIHSGHNEASQTNFTKAAIAKVSSITVDNFQFGQSSSVGITDSAVGDVTGYAFTSANGITHRLQYSTDGGNSYLQTGAYLVGDGTEKVLVDPATDTTGRTYRVITDPDGFATFDWEEFSGNWWDAGYLYTETDNGVTMQPGGRSTAHNAGYGFKGTFWQDEVDGTFAMIEGGVTQDFVVISIDIMGDVGNTNELLHGDLVFTGRLDGVEQWVIDPIQDNAYHTYTTATSGDLSALVDQITWSTPFVFSNETAINLFNNQIDNFSVATSPPGVVPTTPTTLVNAVVVEAEPFAVEHDTQLRWTSDLGTGTWVAASDTIVQPGMIRARYVGESIEAAASYRVLDPPSSTLFFDDFEGDDNWAATENAFGSTPWERGAPNYSNPSFGVDITVADSGINCWGTDLDSAYNQGTDVSLTSPEIDLTGLTSATLQWQERRDIDDTPVVGDDNGYVNIIDGSGTTNLVHTSTSINSEWELISVDLTPYVGGSIRVEYRFKEENVSSAGWGGWYIDDVHVQQ